MNLDDVPILATVFRSSNLVVEGATLLGDAIHRAASELVDAFILDYLRASEAFCTGAKMRKLYLALLLIGSPAMGANPFGPLPEIDPSETAWLSTDILDWETLPRDCSLPEFRTGKGNHVGDCPVVANWHGWRVHLSATMWRGRNLSLLQAMIDGLAPNIDRSPIEALHSRLGIIVHDNGIPITVLDRLREAEILVTHHVPELWVDSRWPCSNELHGACTIAYHVNDGPQQSLIAVNLAVDGVLKRTTMLHELAHVWDHTHLRGPGRGLGKCVELAYNASMNSGRWRNVARHWIDATAEAFDTDISADEWVMVQPYARHSAAEWWAEVSVRWWGSAAEYYPWNRERLWWYDPVAYRTAEALWDW